MGKGRTSAHDPIEFTRAAYDELADCAHLYRLTIEIRLLPTNQRGVFELHLSSTPRHPTDTHLNHTYRARWPCAEVIVFEAFLFQATHRLCRMIESSADNELIERSTTR